MDNNERKAAIESVLFAAGDAIEGEKLCAIFEMDAVQLDELIKEMSDDFDYHRRGLRIIKFASFYQLCTRPEYTDYVKAYAGQKKATSLSNAALEVLAIVVYNQPVTRATIEKIRGVDSSGPLDRLLERDFVEEAGRLEAPGRPILYVTTNEFLRSFGLTSLEELPDLNRLDVEGQQNIFPIAETDEKTTA